MTYVEVIGYDLLELKIEVVNTNWILGFKGVTCIRVCKCISCILFKWTFAYGLVCAVYELVLVIYKYIEGFNCLLHAYIMEENV